MEDLKPCPFCGCRDVWTYIGQSAAKIECQNPECGAKLKNNSVQTMYRENEIPDWAEASKMPKKTMTIKGSISEANPDKEYVQYYWVKPTDSFKELGIASRWNKRVKEAAHG